MPSLRERLHRWRGLPALTGTVSLYVDRGVVPCPAQGDVSVELCLSCPHLRAAHGEPLDRVSCHPGFARILQDVYPTA